VVSELFLFGFGEISWDANGFADMNEAAGEGEGDLELIPAPEGDFVRDGEIDGDDGMSSDLSGGEDSVLDRVFRAAWAIGSYGDVETFLSDGDDF